MNFLNCAFKNLVNVLIFFFQDQIQKKKKNKHLLIRFSLLKNVKVFLWLAMFALHTDHFGRETNLQLNGCYCKVTQKISVVNFDQLL